MKKLEEIVIKHEIDQDADTSYLNKERLEAYHNGNFEYIGVYARAEILTGGPKDWLINYIRTGGVWGIESDNYESIKMYEKEALEELDTTLKELGFKGIKGVPIRGAPQ